VAGSPRRRLVGDPRVKLNGPGPRERLIPTRYWLVLGMFLLSMLLYVDRVCISSAKSEIAAELRLSDTQMGWVLSVFALAYALCQVPSGMLADRFGPRIILSAVVTFWSFFTAMTAAAQGYLTLLLYRFLFGAGEAGAFLGCARAVYSWIPMAERGFMQALAHSGARIGAALTLPVVAWMVREFGWRPSFVVLGVVGLGWSTCWYLWFRDDPEQHPRISESEKRHILRTRQEAILGHDDARPLTARDLIGSRNVWVLMAQYFCSNFTFFFCLTWLFPYLKSRYQLGMVEAGFYAAAPPLAGAVGNWVAGAVIDWTYRRGHWTASRRLPAIAGFLLAAAGLLASVQRETAFGAILCLSVAVFGADMTVAPSWTVCIDIARKHAGTVSGTMNMAGNLGSFMTALAFPYLLQWTGTHHTFFYVGAVLNLMSIGLWFLTQPEHKLEAH
jgi:ACS family glucarate transporter-like MFS transporter